VPLPLPKQLQLNALKLGAGVGAAGVGMVANGGMPAVAAGCDRRGGALGTTAGPRFGLLGGNCAHNRKGRVEKNAAPMIINAGKEKPAINLATDIQKIAPD